MFTINQLAKAYHLSRSTLLYYDKINLLSPSSRTDANYRLYSEQDKAQLAKIVTYRKAGLSLDTIASLLTSEKNQTTELLEQRLSSLNTEISELRAQQQLILKLLGTNSQIRLAKTMNKSQWVKILRASGMDDTAMRKWHIEFERDLPHAHTDFLQSLGISEAEITKIKAWSQSD